MTASGHMTIWMHLRNAREVIAGLRQTETATRILGSSTDRLAQKLERAGRRTFLMNQALFTLRRYSYMATLAFTALGVAVVKWGFDYNNQFQIATVAFKQFGLSARQAAVEANFLFKRIAAPSPFLFQDIALSARRLLSVGFDLKTVNTTLVSITNALTAFGVTSGAALSRATLALMHMQLVGRVTGQALYQLNRDNIPLTEALRVELGLTADQLRNISALGIPAGVAIQALNKYLHETPRFANAALNFSMKTWSGIISTTRDYVARFLGHIEKPLFDRMQKRAATFLRWLTGAGQRGFDRGGIAGMFATFSPGLARGWNILTDLLSNLWKILVNGVIPAFRYVAAVALPALALALAPTILALRFLARHTLLAKIFFGLLAIEVAALTIVMAAQLPIQAILLGRMILMNTLQRIAIALSLARLVVERDTNKQIIASTLVMTRGGRVLRSILLLRKAEIGLMIGQILYTTRLGAALQLMWRGMAVGKFAQASYGFKTLEGRILRMRIALRAGLIPALRTALAIMWEMAAPLLLNPWTWIALAVIGIGILYWKWEKFRKSVNAFFRFMWDHPLLSVFMPVIPALKIILGMLQRIANLIRAIRHPGSLIPHPSLPHGARGWLNLLNPLPFGIPGLASGGFVSRGGLALVGENGPELAQMPTGARVSPISRGVGFPDLSNFRFEITVHNVTELDGQKLAENMSKHRLDGRARR